MARPAGIRIRCAMGVIAGLGFARPATVCASDEPALSAPLLVQIKDDRQLVAAVSAIIHDPGIAITDPAIRPLAQALILEGVKQWRARSFDQALANLLAAYAKLPSPRLLLAIASALRDLGRLADAANTYQRYLLDPASAAGPVGEVTELLGRLDEQLTTLTVRVAASGSTRSTISIDGGPFVAVGAALVTRVRPGLHLVRIREADRTAERTINGFEGEAKQVDAARGVPGSEPAPAAARPTYGWLITGTQYATEDAATNHRSVRAGSPGLPGELLRPIVPAVDTSEPRDAIAAEPAVEDPAGEPISSGVIAAVRIDGELRGFAVGAGVAIARGRVEADLMILRSGTTGGYFGARYRMTTGWLRPYLGAGTPGFLYDRMDAAGNTSTQLAIGLRAAAGLEIVISRHLSMQADAGFEHFFGVTDTIYDANVFVPTLGVIGRL